MNSRVPDGEGGKKISTGISPVGRRREGFASGVIRRLDAGLRPEAKIRHSTHHTMLITTEGCCPYVKVF